MTNGAFYLQWRVSAFKLNHVMPGRGVDIIRELFRHTLFNCNAGSESPLFSWQRHQTHHYPRELRDRADTGRDRADMLVIR